MRAVQILEGCLYAVVGKYAGYRLNIVLKAKSRQDAIDQVVNYLEGVSP